jgi:hypothetical protein
MLKNVVHYINIIVVILSVTCFLKIGTESQIMYLGAISKVHSLKIQNIIVTMQSSKHPATTTCYAVIVPTF